MARPFSLTMQAHRLDLHRLWQALLGVSSLMALGWGGWAVTDHVVVYEHSTRVEGTVRLSQEPTVDPQGNVQKARVRRHRWLEAHFPAAAEKTLWIGQEAVAHVVGDSGEQALAAVVTGIRVDGKDVRAVLRVAVPEDGPDPFENPGTMRVKVAVGMTSPLDVMLSGQAPAGQPQVHDDRGSR